MPKKKKAKPPATRAGGRMTEAQFWEFVRSNLRRMTMRWPPRIQAKLRARRPSQSSNKRLKWESQCSNCLQWFPEKQTQVHHNTPCGKLTSFDDLPGYVERALCELPGFRVLCLKCHREVG